MNEIHIDLKEIYEAKRFFKRAQKAFQKAAASTLNSFAFGTRKASIHVIDTKMTIRKPAFVHGSIKVQKANSAEPVGVMHSMVGSVERPRFTGLAEQELGKPSNRLRVFTSAARGGNKANVTPGWARLKPSAKIASPNKSEGLRTAEGRSFDLKGLTGAKRIVAFLHILSESKADQSFIIRKPFGRFKRGLYRFKQGVIRKVQSFGKRLKPKRIPWLTEGRTTFMTQANINKAWRAAIDYQIKKVR